ncbi:MAG: methyltransferase domain-containing protein [bacterium]
MKQIKEKLLQWPDGLLWKKTEKIILKSRKNKYDLFISLMKPRRVEKLLDVGVSPFLGRATNFLELWYPYPENITALTNDESEKFKNFNRRFPKVRLVFGDGKNLPFPDNCFDIVFSNAVVEHVGGGE